MAFHGLRVAFLVWVQRMVLFRRYVGFHYSFTVTVLSFPYSSWYSCFLSSDSLHGCISFYTKVIIYVGPIILMFCLLLTLSSVSLNCYGVHHFDQLSFGRDFHSMWGWYVFTFFGGVSYSYVIFNISTVLFYWMRVGSYVLVTMSLCWVFPPPRGLIPQLIYIFYNW